MSELPPSGPSFESNSFGERGASSNKGEKKKSAPNVPETKPAWSLREVGNVPQNESKFPFKPLGGDAVKTAGLFEQSKGEGSGSHHHGVERAEPVASERNSFRIPEVPEPEMLERAEQPEWKQVSPEQLAEIAAQEARAEMTLQAVKAEDEKVDKAKAKVKTAGSADSTPPARAHEAPLPEPELPLAQSAEEILERAMPTEFIDATSEHEPTGEATSDLPMMPMSAEAFRGSGHHDIPAPGAETEAVFQDIVNHPNMADVGGSAPQSDDEIFRDMAHNEGEEDPGEYARYHDVVPGEPPVDMGSGNAGRPPFWSTAEGAAYNGGNGGSGNPNAVPTPFGAGMDPITAAGLAGLGARERFHHWQHRAAEVALLGGEVLLGAGLIGEHLWNSHKRRQMRRDYNKKFKKQSEALRTTNETLQHERQAHQRTQRRVENLAAAQAATADQLHHARRQVARAGETLAGPSLISAAAAAELAAKLGEKPATSPAAKQAQEREMAHRLKHSREFGRAIRNNPELPELRSTAEFAGLAASTPELQPAAAEIADAAKPIALQQEMSHERLKGQYRDAAGGIQSAGGADSSGGNAASLPSPQSVQSGSPAGQSLPQYAAAQTKAARADRTKLTVGIAAGTVLVIIGVVLIAVFG